MSNKYTFYGNITIVTPIIETFGKVKEKCTFVVENGDIKISFILFDDKIRTLLEPLEINDYVKVDFSIKSTESRGNWYTSCYALNVTKVYDPNAGKKHKKKEEGKKVYGKLKYFHLNCSKQEAKSIYKELCKIHHPDLPSGSLEIMQEINKEYEKFRR